MGADLKTSNKQYFSKHVSSQHHCWNVLQFNVNPDPRVTKSIPIRSEFHYRSTCRFERQLKPVLSPLDGPANISGTFTLFSLFAQVFLPRSSWILMYGFRSPLIMHVNICAANDLEVFQAESVVDAERAAKTGKSFLLTRLLDESWLKRAKCLEFSNIYDSRHWKRCKVFKKLIQELVAMLIDAEVTKQRTFRLESEMLEMLFALQRRLCVTKHLMIDWFSLRILPRNEITRRVETFNWLSFRSFQVYCNSHVPKSGPGHFDQNSVGIRQAMNVPKSTNLINDQIRGLNRDGVDGELRRNIIRAYAKSINSNSRRRFQSNRHSRHHISSPASEMPIKTSNHLISAGFQRQTTPNGQNGNGSSVPDHMSPVLNDSADYKYGKYQQSSHFIDALY